MTRLATNSLHYAAERWLRHEVLPKIFREHHYEGGEAGKALATALEVAPDVISTLEKAIAYLQTTPPRAAPE
jgi:hypothetical protein